MPRLYGDPSNAEYEPETVSQQVRRVIPAFLRELADLVERGEVRCALHVPDGTFQAKSHHGEFDPTSELRRIEPRGCLWMVEGFPEGMQVKNPIDPPG